MIPEGTFQVKNLRAHFNPFIATGRIYTSEKRPSWWPKDVYIRRTSIWFLRILQSPATDVVVVACLRGVFFVSSLIAVCSLGPCSLRKLLNRLLTYVLLSVRTIEKWLYDYEKSKVNSVQKVLKGTIWKLQFEIFHWRKSLLSYYISLTKPSINQSEEWVFNSLFVDNFLLEWCINIYFFFNHRKFGVWHWMVSTWQLLLFGWRINSRICASWRNVQTILCLPGNNWLQRGEWLCGRPGARWESLDRL